MPFNGTLVVHVTSANGAYPLRDASVLITGQGGEVAELRYALVTDRDGNTVPLLLPAPDPALSNAPNPASLPYSVFDVSVRQSGYYEKNVFSISIFPGIKTILPVNMIPISEFDSENNAPLGTQDVISGENPSL